MTCQSDYNPLLIVSQQCELAKSSYISIENTLLMSLVQAIPCCGRKPITYATLKHATQTPLNTAVGLREVHT